MRKLSIKSTLAAFFVIAILFIFYLGLATFTNMRQTHGQSERVAESLYFLHLTESLFNHLQQYEAAQRGYLFTSKEKFTEVYQTSADSLGNALAGLQAQAQKYPSRAAELSELRRLLIEKMRYSEATVDMFKIGGIYSAANMINQGTGRLLSDSIRFQLLLSEQKDHAVLKNANLFLENLAKKTAARLFVLASVFLLILVAFLYVVWKDFHRLQEATKKLKYQASLIDTIPDAVFTTDKNLIIQTWNQYAAELYGTTVQESIGKSMAEIFKIQLDTVQRDANYNELVKKHYFKEEYSVKKKDGSIIFILGSVSAIFNSEGIVTGYLAVHRDITQRKHLEKSQQEFSLEMEKQVIIKTAETTNILERITDGFLALDSNFVFTFVNKKAGEILGFAPEAMIGKNIFADFPDTASNVFNNACLASFQQQQYTFLENDYRPLNIWIENDIYPSADGLSVFFKDTTFKKNAELALRESEERYRYLIENIHAGVVVHRPDTSIVLCNQEASRLLGMTMAQLNGKAVPDPGWSFVNAEGKKLTIEQYPVCQVISTGKPLGNFVGGIDHSGATGRVWVLINAFPEYDTAMNLLQVVVTFVDITDSKKAAEELKRSETDLNVAQSIAKTGSWEFDRITKDLKWSKELFRIYEISPDTPGPLLYETYRNRHHPDDLLKLDQLVQAAIIAKKGYSYQHRIIVKNGVVKYILGIGEVTLNEQQEVVGLKGTGQDVTDMVKTDEKLQDSFKQIKQLVTHLQNIREQERTSIAREIHDELGQQLTGLKMYISWLNKKCASDEQDIKEKFVAAIELIEDTIRSVRKISTDLRPSMLDDLGLLAALEWQSSEFEKRFGINTRFVNLTANRQIPDKLKTGLFRIYQESLTNVARHAEAAKVISSLKFEEDCLVLTITDDGKGFTLRNIESKKTLGIFGMKERALEMGGLYEIKSEPGLGTTVSVIVPLK